MRHKRSASTELATRRKHTRRIQSLDTTSSQALEPPKLLIEASRISHSSMLGEVQDVIIDTRLPYRVGSPMLPVQPVNTIAHLAFKEWWEPRFRADIDTILREEEVHQEHVDIVKRVQRGENIQTMPKTLMIVSDVSLPGMYENWKRAVIRLRRLLLSKNRLDVTVEIIDSKAVRGVAASAIGHEDVGTVHGWEKISNSFLKEIRSRDWLSIDVIGRELGKHTPTVSPTICITARDANEETWWTDMLPRLRGLIPAEFKVDLFHGHQLLNSTPGGSEQNETKEERRVKPEIFTTMQSYNDTVLMGASIGVEGYSRSGTVSAQIELLSQEGETIHCALTNHHVIAKEDGIAKEHHVGTFMGPNDRLAREEKIRIVSPSDDDHERLREWKRMQIEDFEGIQKLEGERGREHQGITANLALARKEANVLGLDSKLAPNRYLGHVWASSGYRVTPSPEYTMEQARKVSRVRNNNDDVVQMEGTVPPESLAEIIDGRTIDWGLNWALIKLQSSRSLSKYVPPTTAGMAILEGAPATTYRNIRPDRCYKVAKIGRTSGWTTGTINQVGSIINLRHDNDSVIPVNLRNRFETIVLAYGILPDRQSDFIAGGDSGSVVLLNERAFEATILGLGFASNYATLVAYMMPMSHVVSDIEMVTGCKVKIPALVGEAPGKLILDM